MKNFLILVITVVWLVACGGGTNSTPPPDSPMRDLSASGVSRDSDRELNTQAALKEDERPVIKEVKLVSAKKANENLVVEAVLENPDDNVIMEYRWIVGQTEILDVRENVLPHGYFKKGDWVQCWVKAIKEDLESVVVKSKLVKIQSEPPQIQLDPPPPFSVPGTFYYKIKAVDPNIDPERETSKLRFELISPKDAGIKLNEATGELEWLINDDVIQKLGSRIEIKFLVYTEDGVGNGSSLVLNFQPKETEQETEKEESVSSR